MSKAFESFWEKHFSSIPPAAHILRVQLADRWVRFHSLPDSKRYPENRYENRTVLERANALGTDILGRGTKCWLVTNLFTGADTDREIEQTLPANYLKPSFCWQEETDDVSEEEEWTAYTAECTWHPNQFDDLIMKIANDQEPSMLWISQATTAVFAPYDGGTDLILPSSTATLDLRKKYPEWLSSHPDGL